MPLAKADIHKVELGLATLQFNYLHLNNLANNLVSELENSIETQGIVDRTVEDIVLAEKSGVDVMSISSLFSKNVGNKTPSEVLREAGKRTTSISLVASAPDVIYDDPDFIFSRFAELEREFPGRIELTLDRDTFGETVGQDTGRETKHTFNERLVRWSELRAESEVSPRLWIDVAGRSDAILQAASHQIPLQLQYRDGNPLDFKPFADLYFQAISRFGDSNLPLSVQIPGFVAEDEETANEFGYKYWKLSVASDAPESELRARFEYQRDYGGYFCGTPEVVAGKLAKLIEHFGLHRCLLRYPCGMFDDAVLHEHVRLFGEEVIPLTRELLRSPAVAPSL